MHAGCCFFFGGLFHHVQSFNALANQVCNSLLFLAVVGLTLPIAAATLPGVQFSENEMLIFSRIIAILLLAVYITYLYFQLMSHNDLFVASKDQEIVADNQNQLNENNPTTEGEGDEEEEEEEQPVLTITAELLTLLTISIIVAMASECAPVPCGRSLKLVRFCAVELVCECWCAGVGRRESVVGAAAVLPHLVLAVLGCAAHTGLAMSSIEVQRSHSFNMIAPPPAAASHSAANVTEK